ncbi:hypothetical protein BDV95DRAFT_583348 [Massariosphaeria phaeospora]|uniref:Enoyl reductase (ER) domain-containing protein n=1 Tax=Massariosphaeria phaeospora TaxID=100035 RepID=A0A7C8M1D8_9PLEO|nr:hypothetical protein BDV95DRAFT_583348 [Massariosphaeria phaeospora]
MLSRFSAGQKRAEQNPRLRKHNVMRLTRGIFKLVHTFFAYKDCRVVEHHSNFYIPKLTSYRKYNMSPQTSTNPSLPASVSKAIEAIKSLDSSQFGSCFSSDGALVDEGEAHTTHAAIQEWFEAMLRSRNASTKIIDAGTTGTNTWIKIETDGDYEADYGITEPFQCFLYFYLDDQGAIRLLRINQIGPDKATMRAVWAASGNIDDPLSGLRSDVRKVPEIPKGSLRVKLSAVGLNFHDIFTLRGIGMFDIKFPLILGNEGAGTLDDGTEVVIFPVMGNLDYEGDETLDPDRHVLGELTQGSLADYVVVPERNVVKKPENMSMETASVLGVAWLTAYRMLFKRSGLKKGQTMLIQGSTGGIATALIQMGRAAGMTVWTTGRDEAKRAFALELGAHRAFSPGEELPEKVAAVFDMSGEHTFAHSIASVATGGTVVSCGLHSGGMFAQVDLVKLFTQGVNIHGSYMGSRGDFEDLVKFVGEKDIVPFVETVLPLERAKEGLEMLLKGRARGKVVVRL